MRSLSGNAPSGVGRIRHYISTPPAAGADWIDVVPAGVRWRVLTVTMVMICSAVVANREMQIVFLDNSALRIFMTGANTDHPASVDKSYMCGNGVGYLGRACITIAGAEKMMCALPNDLWLNPGYVVGTAVGAIQVGDQISQPQLLVEEWTA